MAKHIFKGEGAPSFAPKQVGHHYVDTLNELQYLSTGITDSSDWKLVNSTIGSINGLTAAAITLDTTSNGTAPTVTQTAPDAIHINIPEAAASGVASGLISNERFNSFNSRLYPENNVLRVVKNTELGPQDFNSVKDAVDSVIDASVSNPYLILVSPGTFVEDTITMKSYVTVQGSGRKITIISCDSPSKNVFELAPSCLLSKMTIRGATGTGQAAMNFLPTTVTGDPAYANEIDFGDNYTFINLVTDSTFGYIDIADVTMSVDSNPTAPFIIKSLSGQISALVMNTFRTAFYIANPNPVLLVQGTGTTVTVTNSLISSALGGTGKACVALDGAVLNVRSTWVVGFDTSLEIQNTGAGCNLQISDFISQATINDLLVSHPGTVGAVQGQMDSAKITIDSASTVKLDYIDPTSPDVGNVILGEIRQGDRHDQLLSISKLARQTSAVGVYDGGFITPVSGTTVMIAAGAGFVEDVIDEFMTEVSWANTNVVLPSAGSNYIFVNSSGTVTFSGGFPDYLTNVILGRVVTVGSAINYIETSSFNSFRLPSRIEEFQREALGPIYASGSIVTENGTRGLNVSAGIFYFGNTRYVPVGGTAITWKDYYRNGSGGYTVASQSTVDNAKYDDGSGTLANLTVLNYAKHALYIVGDDGNEKYHLVYSQTQYAALALAQQGNIPTPPPDFTDGVTLIATIIVKQGTTNIVEVRDERPVIGFKAGGVSATTFHGNLLGLNADDHPQYLLANGTRSMSGALNMGTNPISNVGTVDGVTVSAHASRHLPNGADPLTTAAPGANLTATTTNIVGIANDLARSDHGHAITTGAASTQTPDQSNATGSSVNIARADHVHNIPTAAAVGLDSTSINGQGNATSFARANHTHAIASGTPATQNADQSNAVGSSPNFAKADHIHNIPTAVAVNLNAGTSNGQGVAITLAKSDHTHAIASGAPITQNPDQSNATGASTNFARADHIHNIPTATASSLTTSSTNGQGASTSFAKADHTHAISIVNSEASATATTTTTSATDALMSGMTLTPVAGIYLVFFSTYLNSNTNDATVSLGIYSGGSSVAHTQRTTTPQFSAGGLGGAPTIPLAISTNGLVTVNGSQAIEIRWRRSAGTATANQRTLNIIKLSN